MLFWIRICCCKCRKVRFEGLVKRVFSSIFQMKNNQNREDIPKNCPWTDLLGAMLQWRNPGGEGWRGEIFFALAWIVSRWFFCWRHAKLAKMVKRGKTPCLLGGSKMKHHVTCCFGTTASSCNDWRRKGDRSLQYPLGVFCQTSFRLKGRLWGKCDISYKKTREFFQKMIETLTFVRSKRGSFGVRTSIGKQDFHFQWFDAPAHQDVKWWRNLRGKKWVWPGKPFGVFIPLPISSTKWVGTCAK